MEHELHLQRAEEAYKAFQILSRENLIRDAISRGDEKDLELVEEVFNSLKKLL